MGDYHVMVLVFFPKDKTFVLVRNCAYNGKPEGVGFVGGRNEPEDSEPEATAKREVLEETGIDVKILGEIGYPIEMSPKKKGGSSYTRYFYLAAAENEGNPNKIAIENGVQQTRGWIKVPYVPTWREEEDIAWPEGIYHSHKELFEENQESLEHLLFHYDLI